MPVRVRFAPSPTGPLHIGGVRTALYNYLFARKNNGKFILRIEDTDQDRYVENAEAYIQDALKWLELDPDESPSQPGEYGPYRQSERRKLYSEHVKHLLSNGQAYYAFDTPGELEQMRKDLEEQGVHTPKYDHTVRMKMTNSLTMTPKELMEKLSEGVPYTIRMKIEPGQEISFQDEVRGEVVFKTEELDDKVLIKSDGWPTYHLANVVDDRLMRISHVIRGEEWLSSTPHHVYLYRAFGWADGMPVFVHLPLILKPSGKGKLSKRDGAKFGFPVFPLNWVNEEVYDGFRETGFLPGAVINFLALLGWHPEDDREMFSLKELSEAFEIPRISKSGAKFDYDKAKWFNQQYMLAAPVDVLVDLIREQAIERYGPPAEEKLEQVVELLVPRAELLNEILDMADYFFNAPSAYEEKPVRKKWKAESEVHFVELIKRLQLLSPFERSDVEKAIKEYIKENDLSFGAILPLLRVGLTGTLNGPDLFAIFEVVGRERSCVRLTQAIAQFKEMTNNV